jgi:hypothetical protein
MLGVAILAVILSRLPFSAFRAHVGHGPHLQLAILDLVISVVTLTTDSAATWVGLIALRARQKFTDINIVRGATYALFLLNYAVGQGAFGYYLHRSGFTALRAVGATLFLLGANLAALLLVAMVAALFGDAAGVAPQVTTVLAIIVAALVVYLFVIAIRPLFLMRRELLGPLFDAGVRGHAIAIASRIPHVACAVFGQWLALRVWGIPVPLVTGIVTLPIVLIAGVLPISPAGLGTTQTAFVYLFSSFAVGATADDRQATVFAFAIVHFVYGVLAALLVGLAYLPIAKRRGVLQRPASA